MRKSIGIGIAIVVGAFAPASAMGKAKPKAKRRLPDLRITKIEVPDWESFAYAAVETDGQMRPFTVYVTTRNDGTKATDKPSVTLVFFRDSSGRAFQQRINVPKLKAGKQITKHVTMTADKPTLGFARLGAMADFTEKIGELSENNNFGPPGDDPFTNHHKGIKFAIVPREWHPAVFETDANGFPAKVRTYNAGLRFKLSSVGSPEGFTYLPYGTVSNQADATGICTGSDSETRSHNLSPWDGALHISPDLDQYWAEVLPGPLDKYSIAITCLGVGSHTETHEFLSLTTENGKSGDPWIPKAANATVLQGQFSDGGTMTKWIWDLRATIP